MFFVKKWIFRSTLRSRTLVPRLGRRGPEAGAQGSQGGPGGGGAAPRQGVRGCGSPPATPCSDCFRPVSDYFRLQSGTALRETKIRKKDSSPGANIQERQDSYSPQRPVFFLLKMRFFVFVCVGVFCLCVFFRGYFCTLRGARGGVGGLLGGLS